MPKSYSHVALSVSFLLCTRHLFSYAKDAYTRLCTRHLFSYASDAYTRLCTRHLFSYANDAYTRKRAAGCVCFCFDGAHPTLEPMLVCVVCFWRVCYTEPRCVIIPRPAEMSLHHGRDPWPCLDCTFTESIKGVVCPRGEKQSKPLRSKLLRNRPR